MSRHNRERRRAGVLKRKPLTAEQIEAHGRANDMHRRNLAFQAKIRQGQSEVNRDGHYALGLWEDGGYEDRRYVLIKSYPQHWTPEWHHAHGQG